jgi:hypothetical protein
MRARRLWKRRKLVGDSGAQTVEFEDLGTLAWEVAATRQGMAKSTMWTDSWTIDIEEDEAEVVVAAVGEEEADEVVMKMGMRLGLPRL